MDQYRPAHRARMFPELSRPVYAGEHRAALEAAQAVGLLRIDRREARARFR
jgi:uncharacterized Fe-S radical SAM superfamily protein PflX